MYLQTTATTLVLGPLPSWTGQCEQWAFALGAFFTKYAKHNAQDMKGRHSFEAKNNVGPVLTYLV